MKTKLKNQYLEMTDEMRGKELEAKKQSLDAWKLNRYTKQSRNSREGRNLKREIAILSTMQTAKELAHE